MLEKNKKISIEVLPSNEHVILENCDGWHFIEFERIGYLHDVHYYANIRFIQDDEIGTSISACKQMIADAYADIKLHWELAQQDYANSWHKIV